MATTRFGTQNGHIVAITAWCECVLMPPMDDQYTPEVPDDAKRMVPKMIPLRCSLCGTRPVSLYEWDGDTRDWRHRRCYCACMTKLAAPLAETEAEARQSLDKMNRLGAWPVILAESVANMGTKELASVQVMESAPGSVPVARIGRLRHIREHLTTDG